MPLANLTTVSNQTFDFIVVGGGTSGLCVASRLTEDPRITVLVLEAGDAHFNDPAIIIPGAFGRQLMNPAYDWMHKTVPQRHTNGITYVINSGKGLGGSSALNFLAWNKPGREDIDAWEKLGNRGWGWASFLESTKKAERFVDSSYKHQLQANTLGKSGPLVISFPSVTFEAIPYVREALQAKGVSSLENALSGEVHGTWHSLATVNPATQTRSYSVTAYLEPSLDRPNLLILTGAYVDKLLTSSSEGIVSATSVQFIYEDKTYVAHVAKDVVLCAGALKSPAILELSGIGDSAVLKPLGIDVKVHLPGVGNNVQEHISHAGVSFELKDDNQIQTFDLLKDPENMAKHKELYEKEKRGLFTLVVSGLTMLSAQTFSDKAAELIQCQSERINEQSSEVPASVLDQWKIQLDVLKDARCPDMEFIAFPAFRGYPNPAVAGKRYFSIVPALCHPWSRGSIHITSKDSREPPCIDPHYLEEDIDLQLMAEAINYARQLAQQSPLKDILVKEVNPGSSVVSDDDVREHVKGGMKSTWHTCGSLSMMPSEKDGVVDTELKVHGTSNIRVADLSVAPMQVACHTQSIVYSVAERAAEIMKAVHNLF